MGFYCVGPGCWFEWHSSFVDVRAVSSSLRLEEVFVNQQITFLGGRPQGILGWRKGKEYQGLPGHL